MAEVCIGDTDSSATCGNINLSLQNFSKNQDFIIVLRLQRQMGGTCSWSQAPIVLRAGYNRTVSIPTLSAAGNTPGGSDPISRFTAFRPGARRALIMAEMIRVSQAGTVSESELADDDAGTFAAVNGKVDWDTHHIMTSSLNTCDDTTRRTTLGNATKTFLTRNYTVNFSTATRQEATGASEQIVRATLHI